MPDEHYPTLRGIAADRDWWPRDSGALYRELAAWLRDVACKCRLPNPQRADRRRDARLADFLQRTIDEGRYPLSQRIRTLKGILAKIEPQPTATRHRFQLQSQGIWPGVAEPAQALTASRFPWTPFSKF